MKYINVFKSDDDNNSNDNNISKDRISSTSSDDLKSRLQEQFPSLTSTEIDNLIKNMNK